jgi:hypothetical protein
MRCDAPALTTCSVHAPQSEHAVDPSRPLTRRRHAHRDAQHVFASTPGLRERESAASTSPARQHLDDGAARGRFDGARYCTPRTCVPGEANIDAEMLSASPARHGRRVTAWWCLTVAQRKQHLRATADAHACVSTSAAQPAPFRSGETHSPPDAASRRDASAQLLRSTNIRTDVRSPSHQLAPAPRRRAAAAWSRRVVCDAPSQTAHLCRKSSRHPGHTVETPPHDASRLVRQLVYIRAKASVAPEKRSASPAGCVHAVKAGWCLTTRTPKHHPASTHAPWRRASGAAALPGIWKTAPECV